MTDAQKKTWGFTFSILSGCLYGANFLPPQHLIDSHKHMCSSNGQCKDYPSTWPMTDPSNYDTCLYDTEKFPHGCVVGCMSDGYSHNSLDYCFSHFCGIFVATQIYFL